MADKLNNSVRPSRRELRLARQREEVRAREAEAHSVHTISTLTDTSETAVINLAEIEGARKDSASTSRYVGAGALATKRSAFSIKDFLAGRARRNKHAFIGMGAGLAVTALLLGGMSLSYSNEAQATGDRSIAANFLAADSASTVPDSLAADEEAQALAQASDIEAQAEALAADQEAICSGVASGATSVAGAYASDEQSRVYMPIDAGKYRLSSPYGMRIHPVSGGYKMHNGVDMAAPHGTPIYAVADGEVLSTSWAGSNNGIVIEHHVNGQVFTSFYLHSYANEIYVHEGQTVKAGDTIALVGSAGISTGNHLHFEMHHGEGEATPASEPTSFLKSLGAVYKGQDCEL